MRDRRAIAGISILVGVVLLVWLPRKLSFVRSGPSKAATIIHNLRLIDGAKQEWALEHHQTGAVAVTKEDLAPYLKRPPHLNGWVKPVASERYTIKLLTEPPEAELTRELGHLPKGTRFVLHEPDDPVVLPNPEHSADGSQPFRSLTDSTSSAAGSHR
jgi:hypothetical protein